MYTCTFDIEKLPYTILSSDEEYLQIGLKEIKLSSVSSGGNEIIMVSVQLFVFEQNKKQFRSNEELQIISVYKFTTLILEEETSSNYCSRNDFLFKLLWEFT